MTEEAKPPVTGDDDGAERDAKPKSGDQGKERRRRKSANEEAKDFRLERNTLRQELADLKEQNAETVRLLKAQEDARVAAEATALKASRTAIALKHGIPEALASRLTGTTEAEIEADAIEVAKSLPAKTATPDPKPNASIANPASGGSGLTRDALSKMTTSQVAALDQKEVDRVLAGG